MVVKYQPAGEYPALAEIVNVHFCERENGEKCMRFIPVSPAQEFVVENISHYVYSELLMQLFGEGKIDLTAFSSKTKLIKKK